MTNEVLRIAPGYDYNLSMLCYSTKEDFVGIKDIIDSSKPKIGKDFIDEARNLLTSSIRSDLVKLKGIELSLPFYDEKFTEERTRILTDVVNTQIDNILSTGEKKYPAVKFDGLTNVMKYRMKFGYTEEKLWLQHVPQLFQSLHLNSMSEMEEKIEILLR